MIYNSQLKALALPEYGRHIHQMVEHVMTLETKEERMLAAEAIVAVMGNLFPHLRDVNDFKHKLWDHLAIMSDFKLDIDFPYNMPVRDDFDSKPDKVPYSDNKIIYRHYGKIIQSLIKEAIEMEDGELKNHLISLISSHMRKSLFSWNKDYATDERIQNDIKTLSKGKLIVDIELIKASVVAREQKKGFNSERPQRRTQNRRPTRK